MNTNIKVFYNNIFNKLDPGLIINSVNNNENLYIAPFNYDNIINSNNFNTLLHKLIKEFKIKRGTTKKIIKPGPKEINKFYRDNNITELYNTKKIKIHYINYKLKIKPYFILNDPYDLQTYNYNELLHNKIFDDISNFSKYIIIFLIKPIIEPEPTIIEYITEELAK